MYKFLRDNIHYPEIAKENFTEGIVALTFVIEKDGSIGNIEVLNKVGDGCTEEAIRVVKLMPNWKPGMNHGQPVRVQFNLPIRFRLKN
jgi:protein TonB